MNKVLIVVGIIGVLVALAAAQDRQKGSEDTGRALVDKVYGEVIWRDPKAGIIIAVKKENGATTCVQIDAYRSGANVKLTYPTPGGSPVVTYSSGTLGPSPHMAFWTDLNGDGVFDKLTLTGEWPLLSNEVGSHIWLDEKWVPMRQVERDGLRGVKADGGVYRFDATLGKWALYSRSTAAPVTRPSR